MKTKKEIVAKLLEEGHINFDEALTLMETEKEYITVQPYPQPYPYPYKPYEPIGPWFGILPHQTTNINRSFFTDSAK